MGSSSTTTQSNSPYAPAQPLIDQGLGEAQNLFDRGGFQVDPFQGDLVAGLDPLTQSSLDQTGGVVGRNLQGIGAAQDSAQGLLGQGASDALRQNVIEGILPSLNSTFAGTGMTGSTLHQQNLAKGLASGLGGLELDVRQQQLQAGQQLAGLGGAANQQLGFLGGQGQIGQRQAQNVIQGDALRDQQAQTAEADALRNYLALTTSAGSQFGVQQSTQRNNPGAFEIIGAGLQAAPFLFSDRRLKEDIKRVGAMDDGTPIYTYRYKGGDTHHMGVMADEVQTPEAVLTLPNGIQMVNYGALHG